MSAPAALGLTTYRWNNNLKSLFLLAAFPPLLALLVGGIMYVFGFLLTGPDPSVQISSGGAAGPFQSFGLAPVLGTEGPFDLAVSALWAWWPAIFGIAGAWVLIGYFFNSRIIRMATGAVPVERGQEPKLYNILETLCISRGLTTPQLFIIETDGMNAYASGIDTRSYAVTVTRGLLNGLSDNELEAVLGHELTHILNRDCRLLIVTIVFTGMISFLAQLLWRSALRAFGSSRSRKGGKGLVLMLLVAAVIAAVGYGLALILRFALSRRREYLADAGAVDLTQDPDALVGALRKISAQPGVPNVPSEARQMFIANPGGFSLGGLFATHPPLDDRIRVLEALR